MSGLFASFDLSAADWGLAMLAAVFIGANRSGVVSIILLTVPIFAYIFGGRDSVGIILPVLVMADITAVISYRRSVRWKELIGILPWALCGVLFAVFIGSKISDANFKIFIAAAVIIVLIFLTVKEIGGKEIKLKSRWYINAGIGILGGFTSMIGNASGPILAVYFISLDLEKKEFVSTKAWFFFMINLLKLPFHIFVWKTISVQSVLFDFTMIPAVLAGTYAGYHLVKILPEKPYRIFVLAATFIAAVFMLL